MYKALTLSIVLLGLGTGSTAEPLLIDVIEQQLPNTPQGLLHPHNGETMSRGEDRFGKPRGIDDPKGDPPITRWNYPHFSVVFEYDRIIHSPIEY